MDKLTMPEKIILGAGVVLIIDLIFLPWHDFDLGILNISVTRTGIESPNSFWGVLALLVTIAMVTLIVLTRFTTVQVPDLPVPQSQAMFLGGVIALALLGLKLLSETDGLAFGAFLGILLAGGLAYGGFQMKKEAGPASSGLGRAGPV